MWTDAPVILPISRKISPDRFSFKFFPIKNFTMFILSWSPHFEKLVTIELEHQPSRISSSRWRSKGKGSSQVAFVSTSRAPIGAVERRDDDGASAKSARNDRSVERPRVPVRHVFLDVARSGNEGRRRIEVGGTRAPPRRQLSLVRLARPAFSLLIKPVHASMSEWERVWRRQCRQDPRG